MVAKRFVGLLRLFEKIIEDIKNEYIGISSLKQCNLILLLYNTNEYKCAIYSESCCPKSLTFGFHGSPLALFSTLCSANKIVLT